MRFNYWMLLALLALTLPALAGEGHFSLSRVSDWLDAAPLTPLLFILAYLLAQQLFLSSTAFNIIGGALFGPWLGALLNLSGAILGATLSFQISRHLLATRLASHLPHTLHALLEAVEREGWRGVAFVRLLPGLPYAMLNYLLGLTRLSLPQFLWPTLLCVGPRIVLYTYLGHSGRAVLEGKAERVWHILIALGLLVAVTWLPHLWRRLRTQ